MKYDNFYDEIKVVGDEALNATLAATAISKVSGGGGPNDVVRFTTSAAHGFIAGSHVYIEGTTNYDGVYEILNVAATTTFDIRAKFVAETPAGTETVKVAIVPNADFKFLGFSIHLSAAPTTSENFTITLDAVDGAQFDVVIYSRDFSSASDTDIIWTVPEDSQQPYKKGDKLRVAWANSDDSTYGLKLWYKRRF